MAAGSNQRGVWLNSYEFSAWLWISRLKSRYIDAILRERICAYKNQIDGNCSIGRGTCCWDRKDMIRE